MSEISKECSTTGGECDSNKGLKSNECCPVEMTAECWGDGFEKAMKEVQVDLLKERIKKTWGEHMNQVADAVIESRGAQWHAMLQNAHAHMQLRESIKGVFINALKS